MYWAARAEREMEHVVGVWGWVHEREGADAEGADGVIVRDQQS